MRREEAERCLMGHAFVFPHVHLMLKLNNPFLSHTGQPIKLLKKRIVDDTHILLFFFSFMKKGKSKNTNIVTLHS